MGCHIATILEDGTMVVFDDEEFDSLQDDIMVDIMLREELGYEFNKACASVLK